MLVPRFNGGRIDLNLESVKPPKMAARLEFGHWLSCELVLHFEVVAYD